MNRDEQTLIDGLFSRLQQAERQSAARDAEAEAHLGRLLREQPAAPYYMAQALLVQEAALKRLDQRVRELEAQAAEAPAPGSGGFLAGLFGGGQPAGPTPAQRPAGWGETRFSQNQPAPTNAASAAPVAPGGGFMRGALQTAAGVAGGVMAADLLTNLFHQGQPQEIVEVIREDAPLRGDPFGQSGDASGYAASDDMADDGFDTGPGFFDDDGMFS